MRKICQTVKSALRSWHSIVAQSPLATKVYLSIMSHLCRRLLPSSVGTLIETTLQNYRHDWPVVSFSPRQVQLGDNTFVNLIPHTGEFDQEALFKKRIGYERAVMKWLELEAPRRYDRVIEIGANVGLYSVFFDAICGGRLREVIAFEPAVEPFRRLLANLAVNDARHVTPFMLAVGEQPGFLEFFEPEGHLTNGSLLPSFAAMFSNRVDSTLVASVGPAEIERFFQCDKVLLKIDVEGFEPQLLHALSPLIEQYAPDILIEVLAGTPEGLAGQPWLAAYKFHLLTDAGAEIRNELSADGDHRDWWLSI